MISLKFSLQPQLKGKQQHAQRSYVDRPQVPLTNYSLSTVCPACDSKTYKLACKVRCPKCGFVWDCSEL